MVFRNKEKVETGIGIGFDLVKSGNYNKDGLK
jgi:hypothetical protein